MMLDVLPAAFPFGSRWLFCWRGKIIDRRSHTVVSAAPELLYLRHEIGVAVLSIRRAATELMPAPENDNDVEHAAITLTTPDGKADR